MIVESNVSNRSLNLRVSLPCIFETDELGRTNSGGNLPTYLQTMNTNELMLECVAPQGAVATNNLSEHLLN